MTDIIEVALLAGAIIAAVMTSIGVVACIAREASLSKIRAVTATNHYGPRECMNATEDLYYDLKTAGFNPKILAGRIGSEAKAPEDINHVWIVVEDLPGDWVTVESTAGRVIPESLERYYRGAILFETPGEMWTTYRAGVR